jgi:hypothetical protein
MGPKTFSRTKKRWPLRASADPLLPRVKKLKKLRVREEECIDPIRIENEKRQVKKFRAQARAQSDKYFAVDPTWDSADDSAPFKRAKSGGEDPYFINSGRQGQTSRAENGGQASVAVSTRAPTRSRDGLSGPGTRQETTSAALHELPHSQRRSGLSLGGQRGATGQQTTLEEVPLFLGSAESVSRPGISITGAHGGASEWGIDSPDEVTEWGGRGDATDEQISRDAYSLSAIDTGSDDSDRSDAESIDSTDDTRPYNEQPPYDTDSTQPSNKVRSYATHGHSIASNVSGASSPQTPSLVKGGGCCGGNSNVPLTRLTGTHDTLSEAAQAMQEGATPTAWTSKGARRRAWEAVWDDRTEPWRARMIKLGDMAATEPDETQAMHFFRRIVAREERERTRGQGTPVRNYAQTSDNTWVRARGDGDSYAACGIHRPWVVRQIMAATAGISPTEERALILALAERWRSRRCGRCGTKLT